MMKAGLKQWLVLALCSLLVACGGGGSLSRDEGGSSGGSNGGSSGQVTYQISLSTEGDADQLSVDTPLTVLASVTRSDGASAAGEVVSFTLDDENIADFSVQNGRAVVADNGIATINLIVGEQSGAGTVTASIDTFDSAPLGFTSTGRSQQAAQPAYLDFYASSLQLPSSGQDKIELIALVKNAQNVLMEGVEVSFSASNSGSLSDVNAISAADGTARASLSTINQPENRTITVTATAGNTTILVKSLDIDVVGTEVQLGGDSSVVLGDSAPIKIKLVDSDGKGIAHQTVNVSSTLGQLASNSVVTDVDGQASVTYTATAAGEASISATALNATGQFPLTVQQDAFSFTTVPASDVPLNTNTTLQVTWLKNNSAYAGGTVAFKTSRGQLTSAGTVTTDASGQAQVSLRADNAGIALISAEGEDINGNKVTARYQFEFIATQAAKIAVDATPDSIGPNGQTSTITAVVRDANDNLVKGKVVDFVVDDVSGGTIASNSAITDSKGIASTVFTSNAVGSNEVVQVHATVSDTPSVTNYVNLTVADRPFDISFGTGPLISLPDDSSYTKEFAVFVSDADGNPVANTELSVSVGPVKFNQGGVFRKGGWTWSDDAEQWVTDFFMPPTACSNEDQNDNGLLDVGEDTNGDSYLTPGIVGVIQFKDNNNMTDANGQATVVYTYPREYAPWTDTVIKVSGSSQGTESAESHKFTLAIAADDVTDKAVSPPKNPYGSGTSCTDTN